MSIPLFVTTSVPAGDQVANSTTKTPFATQFPLPYYDGTLNVDDFGYGQVYELEVYGYISTAATPGTLALTCDQYANSGSNVFVLGTTGAFTPPASLTNAPFRFSSRFIYAKTGPTTSGFARADGWLEIQNASNAAFVQGMVATGTGTTGFVAVTTNYDNASLQLTAQWGIANAGNGITLANVRWRALSPEGA